MLQSDSVLAYSSCFACEDQTLKRERETEKKSERDQMRDERREMRFKAVQLQLSWNKFADGSFSPTYTYIYIYTYIRQHTRLHMYLCMSCVVRTLFGTHRSFVKNRCWTHIMVDSGSEWPEGASAPKAHSRHADGILENVFHGIHNWPAEPGGFPWDPNWRFEKGPTRC